MYQLYSDRLPAVFAQLLKKIKEIHSHNTRQTEKSTYFLPRVSKTIGQQLLTFRGVKLWYSIDDTIKDRHWVSFKKAYKKHLIQRFSTFLFSGPIIFRSGGRGPRANS